MNHRAQVALGVAVLALAAAAVMSIASIGSVRTATADDCESTTISSASAVSLAQTRATQVGFSISSTESYTTLTRSELWSAERIDLMAAVPCVWWVVMAGSKTQDRHPPHAAGTPTPTPMTYSEMGVAIDAEDGDVVAESYRGPQVEATASPSATYTDGPAP